MNLILHNSILRFPNLSWLTGPIFGKELRISSRRRRNYIMRVLYLVFLAVFLIVNWVDVVQVGGSSTFTASRMAEAGQRIVMIIIWFQFCSTQFLAVVMLSTAINDEVYNRTLGVLMTTPITSLQIVMGKLLSKLLQLILLLAISLPLLAIVRIFGGVPWGYVISSLCITLTSVIFAGSVSLFFSIFSRRAYVVIILTVLTLGILFGLFLFLSMGTFGFFSWGRQVNAPLTAIFHVNPYMLLALNTDVMINPRLAGRVSVLWPAHCCIMLIASVVLLYVCVRLVRRIALAQATGGGAVLTRLWRARAEKNVEKTTKTKSAGHIRRITGPAVVWKELTSRTSSREKLFVMTIIGVESVMIVAMYLFPYIASATSMEGAHAAYIGIFMGLGSLSVTVFSATCIASEKEARSWPLLLTTTLSDWDILFGKVVGVLRRSLPVWVMLIVYLIPFGGIIAFGVLNAIVVTIGTIIFLCGTGLYISSRLRRVNAAVAAHFVLAGFVLSVFHFLLALFVETFQHFYERYGTAFRHIYGRSLIDCFWDTVPFLQAAETVWSRRRYGSPDTTLYVLGYILLGILFAWLATRRFRRNIF
ncbi:MAG: ABC transporter permease subunit [Sedimentisphaerales bacterium]|nr:ABC transporter permease subunit [Sedimentisphaerales bacterium]